jgi:hypothetical protein
MIAQLLVGTAASLANFAIHAVWTVFLDQAVARFWRRRKSGHYLRDRVALTIGAVMVLMSAHMIEVFVWVATYVVVGASPAGASHTYLAFVNYTTLGYGDVVPVPAWQLLGPLTAMTGVLLFGWSAAAIIEVLRTTERGAPQS